MGTRQHAISYCCVRHIRCLRLQAKARVSHNGWHADVQCSHRIRHQLCGCDSHHPDVLPALPHGGAAERAASSSIWTVSSGRTAAASWNASSATASALPPRHGRARPGGKRNRLPQLPMSWHRNLRRWLLLPLLGPAPCRARRNRLVHPVQADLLPPRAAPATA